MDKQIFVIGHKNPDTDSVVSAAAYARLKQLQGAENCFAKRAGQLTPQTEYIFNRFKAPVPEYLPNLIPQAAYYLSSPAATVNAGVSLWEALERMQKEGLRVLPIVNGEGVYQSMLHHQEFAAYIINNINPHKKAVFPVVMNNLLSTLHALPLAMFDQFEAKKSSILVAAAYNAYFKEHLDNQNPASTLVLVGDRWDIQEVCIRKKVRALVLTSGHTLRPDLLDLAKQNRVTVISTPYDTSSTAMLIIYSVPVGAVGDSSVPLMRLTDTVKKLRSPLSQAPSHCLPIGDDEGRVAGVLFEGDLLHDPNIDIIMVDHNESSQAIEGIENYRILEVLDHHRLGNLSTKYPITFINKVVGATSTIVTDLYREQRKTPERAFASILLCGILADTLYLQSATTTDTDREAAEYLSALTGLDITELIADLQSAANQTGKMSAQELVNTDMKVYTENEAVYTVSQIETDSLDAISARKGEIMAVLEETRRAKNALFAALLATDVTALDSLLFITGEKQFISRIHFPQQEAGVYVLSGIVSRKKQLIPLFSDLLAAPE
ncbi:MAG: putative manganese-dependent inorganic diphosphatase [Spirochaetaceae bacterium]|jgi:manganese-dependent inorganic pyrophosphatase|nr:putative manganese-dependent inorganic diphosphatase [Spirochaetaceae bacterium]